MPGSGGHASVSGSAFFWNALLFTRALRAGGLTTDLGAAIDYSRALTLIDIGDREQVRAAGSAIFVRRRDEVDIYDQVFDRFWTRYELAIEPPDWELEVDVATQDHDQGAQVGAEGGADEQDVVGGAPHDEGDASDAHCSEHKDE